MGLRLDQRLVNQLDHGHLRAVAFTVAHLEDAGVTARAIGKASAQIVVHERDHIGIVQPRSNQRRACTSLMRPERPRLAMVIILSASGADRFGFGLSRFDLPISEQIDDEIAKKGFSVARGTAENPASILMSHNRTLSCLPFVCARGVIDVLKILSFFELRHQFVQRLAAKIANGEHFVVALLPI